MENFDESPYAEGFTVTQPFPVGREAFGQNLLKTVLSLVAPDRKKKWAMKSSTTLVL
jgi:hypothetical protein